MIGQVTVGHWLSIPVALSTPDGHPVVALDRRQLRGPGTATYLNGRHILLHAPAVPARLVFRLTFNGNASSQTQMTGTCESSAQRCV